MDKEKSPLIELKNIRKTFGSVVAVDDVSLKIMPHEITALVGDNGAGKSTLIKCISGVHKPDQGAMYLNGRRVEFSSPLKAREFGIETMYQDLALVNQLTVWQNIFLGREKTKRIGFFRFLDKRQMQQIADETLQVIGIDMPSIHARVQRLSGGQRQGVAVSRTTEWGSQLIIMDEPTAALGVKERNLVEDLIKRLREQGFAILIISHSIDQVMRLADVVWVMRHGQIIGNRRTNETTGEELVQMITGVLK
jgi:simple sugar transport system ATP-binding protein